jgi:hypothetical protein
MVAFFVADFKLYCGLLSSSAANYTLNPTGVPLRFTPAG